MPQWETILEYLDKSRGYIAIAVGVVVVLFALKVLRPLLRRRIRTTRETTPATLDVSTLLSGGPIPMPRLEVYHVPMRLAAVILAPLGRGGELPRTEGWEGLLDQLVPGLEQVLRGHKPRRLAWPVQLSSQGFARSLRQYAPLPGDHGKGTPWSVITGRFEADGQNFAVALLLCAERDNNLTQLYLERAAQWLDVLRVRG